MGGKPSIIHYQAIINDIRLIDKQLEIYADPEFVSKVKEETGVDPSKYNLRGMLDLMNTKKRVATRVFNTIKYGYDCLLALTVGPRCDGSPELFTKQACDESGSRWVPFTTQPDTKVGENARWFQLFKKFQIYFVKELKGSSVLIKNLVKTTNARIVHQIETRSIAKMSAIKTHVSRLYKATLLTPTYTREDIEMIKTKHRRYAAEREALSAASIATRLYS